MNPITHSLLSWIVADAGEMGRRDRTIVMLAGIAPDLDAAGIVVEVLTRNSERPLLWWSDYHHVLGHNLAFGVVVTAVSFALATKRWKAAALACLTFHLHLICDVLGARGPDGYQWPIPYFFPFLTEWQWTWDGQWELNAWPNFLVTGIALLITFYWAWKKGYSVLEMISTSADRAFVETLRHRFPRAG